MRREFVYILYCVIKYFVHILCKIAFFFWFVYWFDSGLRAKNVCDGDENIISGCHEILWRSNKNKNMLKIRKYETESGD